MPGKHNWRVVLRNDARGFDIAFVVEAYAYIQAANEGISSLGRKRHNAEQFVVIAIQRLDPID